MFKQEQKKDQFMLLYSFYDSSGGPLTAVDKQSGTLENGANK
jgi:hypothetical protein